MEKELKRCDKLESALQVIYGGYYKRENILKDKFDKLVKDQERLNIEKEVFSVL